MKKQKHTDINPAFREEAEKILEQIKKNIPNLTHTDLKTLRTFTTLKEYHSF